MIPGLDAPTTRIVIIGHKSTYIVITLFKIPKITLNNVVFLQKHSQCKTSHEKVSQKSVVRIGLSTVSPETYI